MAESNSDYSFNGDRPVMYCIRVLGELGPEWSGRLAGMAISVNHDERDRPVTKLKGKLPDQAALLGALNTLHDLHLPVLSVEYVETEPD